MKKLVFNSNLTKLDKPLYYKLQDGVGKIPIVEGYSILMPFFPNYHVWAKKLFDSFPKTRVDFATAREALKESRSRLSEEIRSMVEAIKTSKEEKSYTSKRLFLYAFPVKKKEYVLGFAVRQNDEMIEPQNWPKPNWIKWNGLTHVAFLIREDGKLFLRATPKPKDSGTYHYYGRELFDRTENEFGVYQQDLFKIDFTDMNIPAVMIGCSGAYGRADIAREVYPDENGLWRILELDKATQDHYTLMAKSELKKKREQMG